MNRDLKAKLEQANEQLGRAFYFRFSSEANADAVRCCCFSIAFIKSGLCL